MENEPIKTVAGNWYSLTCTAAATVTAEIDGEPVTLATLTTGGTTVFCSPAATVTIATAGKYRVLPTKAPALNGNGGGGLTPEEKEKVLTTDGERIAPPADGGLNQTVPMVHATWVAVQASAIAVEILPSATADRVLSMQLLLAPEADMPAGWLTSADPALPVLWPYGEPMLAGGFRYCITLVQLPFAILANMTPLGANPNA